MRPKQIRAISNKEQLVPPGSLFVTDANGNNWTRGGVFSPLVADGRLSASSTDPLPTSDTTSSVLYYLEHIGNLISLFGVGGWRYHDFGSSIFFDSAVDLDRDGDLLVVNDLYDVFVFEDLTGSLDLELVGWNVFSGPGLESRVINLAMFDGVWVDSTDVTRRYIGTVRFGSSGFTDTDADRWVWNAHNQIPRISIVRFSGITTPAVSGITHWATISFVVGLRTKTRCDAVLGGWNSADVNNFLGGSIGLNSTVGPTSGTIGTGEHGTPTNLPASRSGHCYHCIASSFDTIDANYYEYNGLYKVIIVAGSITIAGATSDAAPRGMLAVIPG